MLNKKYKQLEKDSIKLKNKDNNIRSNNKIKKPILFFKK